MIDKMKFWAEDVKHQRNSSNWAPASLRITVQISQFLDTIRQLLIDILQFHVYHLFFGLPTLFSLFALVFYYYLNCLILTHSLNVSCPTWFIYSYFNFWRSMQLVGIVITPYSLHCSLLKGTTNLFEDFFLEKGLIHENPAPTISVRFEFHRNARLGNL